MLLTHELVLSDVTYSDAGTYTCEASNANGEAFNRTYVTVVGEYCARRLTSRKHVRVMYTPLNPTLI